MKWQNFGQQQTGDAVIFFCFPSYGQEQTPSIVLLQFYQNTGVNDQKSIPDNSNLPGKII